MGFIDAQQRMTRGLIVQLHMLLSKVCLRVCHIYRNHGWCATEISGSERTAETLNCRRICTVLDSIVCRIFYNDKSILVELEQCKLL